jgi:mannose-6-phosphate isomerase-like protein (cupin superfamily)
MYFERCNIFELDTERVCAHGGVGQIDFKRIADTAQTQGPCNFIDVATLPPGASIGRHTHAPDEEEFYLIVRGTGQMWRDGERFSVEPGDFIRNGAGGSHGLENTGTEPLTIFVFELKVIP